MIQLVGRPGLHQGNHRAKDCPLTPPPPEAPSGPQHTVGSSRRSPPYRHTTTDRANLLDLFRLEPNHFSPHARRGTEPRANDRVRSPAALEQLQRQLASGTLLEGQNLQDIPSPPRPYRMYPGTAHMDFRVAIVTGVCRSGKTLVGQLLGSMANVEHIDEPWLPMMLPVLQGKGLIDPDVGKTLLQSFTEELFNDMILLRNANFRPSDLSSMWTRKNAQEIFSRLVNLHSRRDVRKYVAEHRSVLLYNLAEVMPYLSFLTDAFPRCKVIHVIRNGLDVATSTAEKQWFSNERLANPSNNQVFRAYQSNIDRTQYYLPWWLREDDSEAFLTMGDFARGVCYWRSLLEQSREQISQLKATRPDAYHEVKYEDLVRAPTQSVNNIAMFLDVTPTEQTAAVLSTLRTEATSPAHPIDRLPQDEMERVTRLLRAFGYPTPDLK